MINVNKLEIIKILTSKEYDDASVKIYNNNSTIEIIVPKIKFGDWLKMKITLGANILTLAELAEAQKKYGFSKIVNFIFFTHTKHYKKYMNTLSAQEQYHNEVENKQIPHEIFFKYF